MPEVIPAEVDSVVLQAVDGTQTRLQMDGGEILNPVLLNSTFCANVVLKVSLSVCMNLNGFI